MSFDLGVWYPHEHLSHDEAEDFFCRMNEGETDSLPHPSVDAFYEELVSIHPELHDVPEERIGDFDYSPWSCSHDRSPGHIIMACVWPKADDVSALVFRLARKHGLVLFDPQAGRASYPDSPESPGEKRPWWRFW